MDYEEIEDQLTQWRLVKSSYSPLTTKYAEATRNIRELTGQKLQLDLEGLIKLREDIDAKMGKEKWKKLGDLYKQRQGLNQEIDEIMKQQG